MTHMAEAWVKNAPSPMQRELGYDAWLTYAVAWVSQGRAMDYVPRVWWPEADEENQDELATA